MIHKARARFFDVSFMYVWFLSAGVGMDFSSWFLLSAKSTLQTIASDFPAVPGRQVHPVGRWLPFLAARPDRVGVLGWIAFLKEKCLSAPRIMLQRSGAAGRRRAGAAGGGGRPILAGRPPSLSPRRQYKMPFSGEYGIVPMSPAVSMPSSSSKNVVARRL